MKNSNNPRSKEEVKILSMLGTSIRNNREKSGFTQENFARLAGFSRSYYTEVESGKRNISFLNLINILKALNIDPNKIIDLLSK